MLYEKEAALGPEYPPKLMQRLSLIGDGAQHERRNGRVEAVVGERKLLGGREHQLHREGMSVQPALQPLGHRLAGLGDRDVLYADAVEGKVGPRSASDLEHPPAGLGDELPAMVSQTRL